MSAVVEIHTCECPSCKGGEQGVHHLFNLLLSRLDEQQRRWLAGLEAKRRGRGGESEVARITGIHPQTIRRGRRELEADLAEHPVGRVRAPGGGRPPVEERDPGIEEALVEALEPETAGKPTTTLRYKRSSLRNLRDRLKAEGHKVSHPTVARLLEKLGYSPKVNAKEEESTSAPPADREAQFARIEEQKREHLAAGEPVISVDSKKKS